MAEKMTQKSSSSDNSIVFNPITEGVIWKQVLLFFFPLLISSFFQQLYNTVDALIVGRIAGKQALSAVGGSAGSVLGIFMMFYIGFAGGAAVTFAAGLFSFVLPRTAPQARGTPISVGDALGLGALVLLRDRAFRSFAIILLLAMIPFQWYNVYCAAYLKDSGYQYLTTTMNIGQVGEIVFMLLVPLIFRWIGYRRSLAVALVVLALRNVFFAISSAYGFAALDFCGIVVHGLIFGLLVVGAQMYVDEVAPPMLRNQAQGLVNLILAGVGVFASNFLFDAILTSSSPTPWTTAYLVAVAISLATAVYGLATAKSSK